MAKKFEAKKIVFPFREALYIAVEDIRMRIRRMSITTLGIVIGIAFMVSLLLISEAVKIQAQSAGVESLKIQTYQFWMAGIALLVCGVGVANAMLMMVTERTKEIGTMKCLGARNRHVSMLFMIEASIVGVVGGILGSFAGIVAAAIFTYLETGNEILITSAGIVKYSLFAIFVSFVLSILATILPARRASKMVPADAMRYEV